MEQNLKKNGIVLVLRLTKKRHKKLLKMKKKKKQKKEKKNTTKTVKEQKLDKNESKRRPNKLVRGVKSKNFNDVIKKNKIKYYD